MTSATTSDPARTAEPAPDPGRWRALAVVMAAVATAGLTLQADPRSVVGRWAVLVQQEWPVFFLWPLALSYVYPDGGLPSARWRPVAAVALVSSLGALGLLLLQRAPEGPYGPVASPLGVAIDQQVGTVLFWICWFGLLGSLFIRPRRVWVRARQDGDGTLVEVAALDRSGGGDVTVVVDEVVAAHQDPWWETCAASEDRD